MKIFHLSDLHLGKRVNGFLMLEDQSFILRKIVSMADEHQIDAVLIAGDIYDKSVPSAEAIELFDNFLVWLVKREIPVFVISGNHDSAERIAFGNRVMSKGGVFLSPVYKKEIEPITLTDDFGNVNIYLLPFIKPTNVRALFEQEEIYTYNDALKVVTQNIELNKTQRNILITHQFIIGAITCDSEEISVGGTDMIDANLFADFDYVALGHLHSPQSVLNENIRYCGSPLKYSFSECNSVKSVCLVELKEKGEVSTTLLPLVPKREMQIIKGEFEEITAKEFYEKIDRDNYIKIILTDEHDIVNGFNKLQVLYPNLMKLEYDNKRTRKNYEIEMGASIEKKAPITLMNELYELQNNTEMSEEQFEFCQSLIEKIWGEEV